MTSRFLTAAGLVVGLAATQAPAADLAIEVRGVRSDDGRVYLAVYGSEAKAAFPRGDGAVAGLREPADTESVRFVVRDLPPGQYAMTAFHDENDNGELDTNLFGIPSEGYGFGNDASAGFGPPAFDAAAVTVGDTSEATVITLNY